MNMMGRSGVLIVKCFIVAVLFSVLNGCYVFKQGIYALRYNRQAENIDVVLKNSLTNDETRKFLMLIKEIRQYAVDSIGLNSNSNYSRYVTINKDYLIDVVSAAEKHSFKQYKWCFPVVGCVPYKGYFEAADATKMAEKLSKKGYDINVDKVDAYSSLGFFSDPLYSFMSTYSVYGIASLIFHEQTHATVYIKNQSNFNEQLATFIGTTGAQQFIRSKYGENSDEYLNIALAQQDYETYLKLLRGLYGDLKEVYDDTLRTRDEKISDKETKIQNFKQTVESRYDSLFQTKRFKKLSTLRINNAYLAVRMTYSLNLATFEKLYEKHGRDLKATLTYLKKIKELKIKDPEKYIESSMN
jgi:predicted aminopeptidase